MLLNTLQNSPENFSADKVYFRKAGHMCGVNKKGKKIKDETSLNNMQVSIFWSAKMSAKIETGRSVQVQHAISV